MYIFLNITQKENVLCKVKKLDRNTPPGNVAFNPTKLEESSQIKITKASKIKRKLNTIKAIVTIIKKTKQSRYITKDKKSNANAKKIIISNINAAKVKAKKATTS